MRVSRSSAFLFSKQFMKGLILLKRGFKNTQSLCNVNFKNVVVCCRSEVLVHCGLVRHSKCLVGLVLLISQSRRKFIGIVSICLRFWSSWMGIGVGHQKKIILPQLSQKRSNVSQVLFKHNVFRNSGCHLGTPTPNSLGRALRRYSLTS